MALYEVEVMIQMVVVAGSEAEAEEVAHRHYGDEEPEMLDATLITDASDLPGRWAHALPWGAADDVTCAEYLEARPATGAGEEAP